MLLVTMSGIMACMLFLDNSNLILIHNILSNGEIDVLQKVKDRFSIHISSSLPLTFIHIPMKRDATTFKRFTLIAESIDTIQLAWHGLRQFNPHIFVRLVVTSST